MADLTTAIFSFVLKTFYLLLITPIASVDPDASHPDMGARQNFPQEK
jgi:hypothetical protein